MNYIYLFVNYFVIIIISMVTCYQSSAIIMALEDAPRM